MGCSLRTFKTLRILVYRLWSRIRDCTAKVESYCIEWALRIRSSVRMGMASACGRSHRVQVRRIPRSFRRRRESLL